ncbi:replication initiation negative regulator SeqA [Parashewanella spongiae]|uniref:Negative modulator of initiation of replication n=1 Tax=Parashewanella spongiae TaxID=342950 RepID=A0A3A6U3I2_9GAMM|nr:replication initiation negative regulator SeqA [Parashewanella spongiae]MCL1077502.1 replication initiation negative regulator SeqA [Parashewanella spongiae]RJY18641.1 replication initiation negative regulator SeqA [Parashewanella spongiae]
MKYIEVDEELYRYIASKTESIGESASDILRRLLGLKIQTNATERPQAVYKPSLDSEQKAEVVSRAKPEPINFLALFSKPEIKKQKGAVGRFLHVLSCLQQTLPSQFEQVLKIQGRGRLYFATTKEALLEASKSANPKQIADSDYWVITNNNTAKKRAIFVEALVLLGCESEQAESLAENI